MSRAATAANVIGSRVVTPNNKLLINGVNPKAPPIPIPTPVNAIYCRVLDDIAHTPPLWAKYRERPDTLEAEVMAEMRRAKARARA